MANRLVNAAKQIKSKDFLTPLIFLMILVPSWIFRLVNVIKHRKLWLVAEQGEARDNGYHFYKYVREKHPEDYCFYAVKPNSAGYGKVDQLGNVIKWGSLRHWLYYMSANLNISSYKSGNPCPIFWYFVHVTLGMYRNRVFLKHGIIKDDLKYAYYDKTKFKRIICGAKPEYEYVLAKFGYKKEDVVLAGLARWDNLEDKSGLQAQRSILVMPTWRNWLGGDKNSMFKISDFEKTKYYKRWNGVINDDAFVRFIEENNIKVYFYPHINMQGFLKSFRTDSENVEIVSINQDIQSFFMKCNLLITDYSSVAFDFAYLGKPIIYYQFDKEEYRCRQHPEGYFTYAKDGFGDVLDTGRDVAKKIKFYHEHNYELEQKYKKRVNSFFSIRDKKNCERIYEAIK